MHIDFLGVETNGKVDSAHEPKPPQVEKAIAGLDGDAHTMVICHAIPDSFLLVSGGKSGWCIVSVIIKQKEFYCLLSPTPPPPGMPDPVKLKVNGVEGMYPKEMLIPKPLALKVAKPFCEKGEIDPSLNWRAENLDDPKYDR